MSFLSDLPSKGNLKEHKTSESIWPESTIIQSYQATKKEFDFVKKGTYCYSFRLL